MALSRIWSAFIIVALSVALFRFFFNKSQDDIFGRMVTATAKDEYNYVAIGDVTKYGYPSIDSFAKSNNFTAPVVWLNETNADYFCPKVDRDWSGAIPATLFINRKKGYRKLVQEEMDKQRFERELKKAL